jgi:hypothetical protein
MMNAYYADLNSVVPAFKEYRLVGASVFGWEIIFSSVFFVNLIML